MEIRLYKKSDDEARLFDMLRDEGSEWECYFGELAIEKYKTALENSRVYVACDCGTLCGYVRARDDDGFGVYIYDLLVKKAFRGKGIGKKLTNKVAADYPSSEIYILSDADEYYTKQGYKKVGSVFQTQ